MHIMSALISDTEICGITNYKGIYEHRGTTLLGFPKDLSVQYSFSVLVRGGGLQEFSSEFFRLSSKLEMEAAKAFLEEYKKIRHMIGVLTNEEEALAKRIEYINNIKEGCDHLKSSIAVLCDDIIHESDTIKTDDSRILSFYKEIDKIQQTALRHL